MLHYILDAHNIMHKDAVMKRQMDSSLTTARQTLLSLVEQYARRRRDILFTIVFDGVNAAVQRQEINVNVRETRRFQEADEVIKDLVRLEEQTRRVTVISSDTEVHNFAKRSGCNVQSAPTFLRELRSDNGSKPTPEARRLASTDKPDHVSRAELEAMKRMFGIKDNP
jgi:predicted RNA-binding protein with PIN domain